MARQWVVLAREDFSVETFHSLRPEGRQFRDHFVKHAASAPDVGTMIIGHVFPDFGAGVVGSSCLCSHHATLSDSRDVHVSQFDDAFLGQEHICALNVTVANSKIMEGFQASDNLDEEVPNLFFSEARPLLLVVVDHHQKVASVSVLHD